MVLKMSKSMRISLDGWEINNKGTCFTHTETNWQIRFSYDRILNSRYVHIHTNQHKQIDKYFSSVYSAIEYFNLRRKNGDI